MLSPMDTKIRIKITDPSISALESLINIAIGRVSVFIAIDPAMVMVAPNSPNAFAHDRMDAAKMPRLLNGSVIVRKALPGEAPRVRATASYRTGISSIAALINLVVTPHTVRN